MSDKVAFEFVRLRFWQWPS